MKRIKYITVILCMTFASAAQGASLRSDFRAYKPWTMLALAATTMNLCTKAEDTFLVNYQPGPVALLEGFSGIHYPEQIVKDVCPFSDGSFGVIISHREIGYNYLSCLNIGADGEVNAYHVFGKGDMNACARKDEDTMYLAGTANDNVGYAALVDKNCTPIWERTIYATSFNDVATMPDEGAIFVGSASYSIYGLKLSSSGEKIFDFSIQTVGASNAQSVIVYNNNIYIGGQAFNTMAFARYSLSGALAYFKTYATSNRSATIHGICATSNGYIAFVAVEANVYISYGKIEPATGDTLYTKFFTKLWMKSYDIRPTDNGGFAFAVQDNKRYLLTFHANGSLFTGHLQPSGSYGYEDLTIVPYNGAHYAFGSLRSTPIRAFFLWFAKIPTTNQATDCISLLSNGHTNIVDVPNTILDRNVSSWNDTTAQAYNSTSTIHKHNATVQRTCINTYTPTFSPTSSPTPSPSGNTLTPSKVPTESPITKSPTQPPTTDSPTKSPTQPPTTGSPTISPTGSPSSSPTKSPTAAPTAAPTGTPTGAPTGTPTGTPTGAPTGAPTNSPTIPALCVTAACTEYNIALTSALCLGVIINGVLCFLVIKNDSTDEVPLCFCCKKKALRQLCKKSQ